MLHRSTAQTCFEDDVPATIRDPRRAAHRWSESVAEERTVIMRAPALPLPPLPLPAPRARAPRREPESLTLICATASSTGVRVRSRDAAAVNVLAATAPSHEVPAVTEWRGPHPRWEVTTARPQRSQSLADHVWRGAFFVMGFTLFTLAMLYAVTLSPSVARLATSASRAVAGR